MKSVGQLELHLTHGCNLACESCSHYSNQNLSGRVSPEEADAWMKRWNRRLAPESFVLLGGEPTLHPDLPRFVSIARENWPEAFIHLITNGFLLSRHPDLPVALQAAGNAGISVSIHHESPEYQEKLVPAVALLLEWRKRYGINFVCRPSQTYWTRRYKGFGATMEPYADADPRSSWENCPARTCRQLFEGKLWKCSPIAYLKLLDAKYPLTDAWRPYLEYEPLAPDCSDAEIDAFLAAEEESICGMCPARPEAFALPSPLRSASGEGVSPGSAEDPATEGG